jgi:gliding motility-associated-like protein
LPFTLFSQIIANFSADTTKGCIPLTVKYTNTSTENGKFIDTTKYLFRWEMDESQNSEKVKTSFNASYSIAGGKNTKLTILHLDGSPITGDSGTVKTVSNNVQVFARPSVKANGPTSPVCVGKTVSLSPIIISQSSPIVSWLWDFGDGSSWVHTQNVTHSYSSKATYLATVYAIDQNGCESTTAYTIPANIVVNSDKPTADFSIDNTATCNSSVTVNVKDSSSFNIGKIIGFKWTFDDGTSDSTHSSIAKTFTRTPSLNQDTKIITLLVKGDNGCDNSIVKAVTLYNLNPTIAINDGIKTVTVPAQSACQGNIQFSTTQENNTSYSWTIGSQTGYGASLTTTSPLAPGTYTVSLTATNPACSVTVTKTFSVEETPSFALGFKGAVSCGTTWSGPLGPTWDQPSTNTNFPIDKVTWLTSTDNFASISDTFAITTGLSKMPQNNLSPNGTYSFKANISTTNGCNYSIVNNDVIAVYYPSFSINIDKYKGCIPLDVNFKDIITLPAEGKGDSIKSLQWDYGDGTKSPILADTAIGTNNYLHEYTKTGTFSAILTVQTKNDCNYSIEATIKPGAPPTIKFNILDNVVCSNRSTDITLNPNYKSGVSIQFLSYGYQDPKDLSTKDVTLYDSTDTWFEGNINNTWKSDEKPQQNKYGDTLNFKFHNDTANKSGIYKLAMTEYYHNCASVFSGDTLIRVMGPFAHQTPVTINCASPFDIHLNAESIIDAQHWEWNTYKAYDNSPLIPIESKNAIKTDTIINFNDTINNPPYKYGTGLYNTILYAYNDTNKCMDSSSVRFIITDTKAKISLNDTTPCVGDTKYIISNGMKDMQYLTSFNWTLTNPDGSIDTTNDFVTYKHMHKVHSGNGFPDYVFPDPVYSNMSIYENINFPKRGLYTIYVIDSDKNFCRSSASITVRAYQPTAGFTINGGGVTQCLPFRMTFNDNSSSFATIENWEWTTGGDSLKTKSGKDISATDIYSKVMNYTISLKVTDSIGCTNTYLDSSLISPLVPAANFHNDTKVCLGTLALFSIDSTLGSVYKYKVDSFVWDFGDGSPTLETKGLQVTHLYKSEISNPIVTVKSYLTSPSSEVCTNSANSNTIDIKDAHASFNTVSVDSSCIVKLLTLNTTLSSRFNSIKWVETYNDSTINKGNLNISSPQIAIQLPGTHTIDYITTSDYIGCEVDTFGRDYTINHSIVKISVDKSAICINDSVTFSLSESVNVLNYPHYWNFGDGVAFDYKNLTVKHTYNKIVNSSPQVQVMFTVDNGCGDFDTTYIYLHQIMADFNRGPADATIQSCVPFTVNFMNTSATTGGTSYFWDFKDGTTSTEANPTHTFTTPDEKYNVLLRITGIDQGTQCTDDSIKQIITFRNPGFTPKYPNTICEGDTLNITLLPTGETVIDSWKNDPSILSLSSDKLIAQLRPLNSTKYIISDRDLTCSLIDTLFVNVQNRPSYNGAPNKPLVFLPKDQPADTLTLKPKNLLYSYVDYSFNNDSLSGVTYKWEPAYGLSCINCSNPKVNVDKDVTYFVTMTNHCFEIHDTISFKIILESDLGLPTAFTPNGDGKNDLVIPRGWGVKEFLEIDIFNRWGQLVYKTNDLTKGWDGTFKGRPQDPDTFAWTIRYKDSKDITQEKKGYITLLR